eukprot:TRINITY_DN310_c0_g1_i1.p1 TRINITY_DN310_c0_g1~~TRINITY_DN310_c0_g1_i1.p1  ORF type:complete len:232 (-),score=70.98 TRINITY_DN310_c0_g1_i1:186-821(-)
MASKKAEEETATTAQEEEENQNQTAVAASGGEEEERQNFEDGDGELDSLKRKVKEMQEEADRLEQIQKQVEEQMGSSPGSSGSSKEVDKRSIYIGNVDYSTTAEELQTHFQSCGTINRLTILCDKWTGHPKGFAYIEFAEEESVNNSVLLEGSIFRGRPLKVIPKRTNIPGFKRGYYSSYRPPPYRRGGGFYGGGGYAPRRPRRPYYHPYM